MRILLPLLIIVFLTLISSCDSSTRESSPISQPDTVYITKEVPYYITPAWAFTGDFKRQYGSYLFEVIALPDPGTNDSVHITISSGSVFTLDTIHECCEIEEVQVRDLDADDLPELYIIGRSPGSGGFLCLDMYEADGSVIDEGDLSKLWSTQRLTFSENQAIHEHWLESADGCCDFVGIEFSYFKLVNNRFKFVKKEEWIHGDKAIVNRSDFNN